MATCPHTMKATDTDGITHCCDCGKVFRRALSKAAQEARRPPHPALLLNASHDRIPMPAKARLARVVRKPAA